MSELDRRRFLALAGVSTAGLAAGGLSVVSGQDKGDKEKLPTKDRSPVKQPAPGETNFEIRIQATGDLEVLAASGLSFGTFSAAEAGGLYEFGQPAVLWAERDKLDAGATADRKAADVPELLAGVPAPFFPVALHPLMSAGAVDSYSIGVLLVPQADVKTGLISPLAGDEDEPSWGFGQRVGNYFIRGSIEEGLLRGCINRRVKHAGFMIQQIDPRTGRGRQLFNLHVAAWWDGNRPCFAVYESERGFCRNSCNYPTWDRIARFVNELAAARGVPLLVAWTLAAAIGVAAIGALTVIPGVPPPP